MQRVKGCYNAMRHERLGLAMSTLATFPIESVALRDGTPVQLRSLHLDDVERIKAFFYRLTPQSIFFRLLEYRTAITDVEARLLCDMDGRTRVAIAATVVADGAEHIIAVARYSLIDPANGATGEAAIVVQDDYQKRGLGTILIRRLVEYARAHGVQRFVATIHSNNAQILRFIERSGLQAERQLRHGVWEFTIYLDPDAARPTVPRDTSPN